MTKPGFVLLWMAASGSVFGAEQVGVAQAIGGFAVDGARVAGNATLFDGATVETDRASSRLRMRSGARVELAPSSKARVSADGLVLEKGGGDVSGAYRVEARTLRIAPEGAAVAKVKLEGERAVLVAASNGPVRVYNHLGDLLANVRAGMALSVLPPAAGQAEGSALTGCLVKREGRYVLTDAASGVTVELRGGELEAQVGKRIRAEGTVFRTATPISGASQVIRVTSVTPSEGGPCEQPAVAETKPATAPATSGVSTPRPPVAAGGGSKVSGALIGVIVAGAGAGAAGAILAAGGDDKSR